MLLTKPFLTLIKLILELRDSHIIKSESVRLTHANRVIGFSWNSLASSNQLVREDAVLLVVCVDLCNCGHLLAVSRSSPRSLLHTGHDRFRWCMCV